MRQRPRSLRSGRLAGPGSPASRPGALVHRRAERHRDLHPAAASTPSAAGVKRSAIVDTATRQESTAPTVSSTRETRPPRATRQAKNAEKTQPKAPGHGARGAEPTQR
jgi:hypothetical protein